MKIGKNDLEAAAAAGIVSAEQARDLWAFLDQRYGHVPQFRFAHVLYYLGGMIAIGAMTLFMNIGWDLWGPLSLTVFAVCYGFVSWRLGVWLLDAKHLPLPAGITFALAIVLVPLAIYGVEAYLGYWEKDGRYTDYHHYIDYRWLIMELATLAVASVMLWRYRLGFMVMPVAVTLWYLGMDVADWIVQARHPMVEGQSWEGYQLIEHLRKWISLWYGVAMLALAFYVDLRNVSRRADYAFWLYLFGMMSFWGALTSMDSNSELGRFLYAVLNVGLILAGAVLGRRVFAPFGAMGVAFYLGHLAHRIFKDSLMFPFALSLIGLGIVFAGIWWNKHGAEIGSRWRRKLSPRLADLIESRS